MSAWDRVLAARDPKRPTAKYYIETAFDGFFELHGDRLFADDPAIVGGIAWLNDTAVTVIGQEKGVLPREKTHRRFGSPNPEGYRKALRLMEQAERFDRPIINLVDTQGAYCGIGAEERGRQNGRGRKFEQEFFPRTESSTATNGKWIGRPRFPL